MSKGRQTLPRRHRPYPTADNLPLQPDFAVGRGAALAPKPVGDLDLPCDVLVLALFTRATRQGAFVLAKALGGVIIVARCIDHLRQHVVNVLGANPGPAKTCGANE